MQAVDNEFSGVLQVRRSGWGMVVVAFLCAVQLSVQVSGQQPQPGLPLATFCVPAVGRVSHAAAAVPHGA